MAIVKKNQVLRFCIGIALDDSGLLLERTSVQIHALRILKVLGGHRQLPFQGLIKLQL